MSAPRAMVLLLAIAAPLALMASSAEPSEKTNRVVVLSTAHAETSARLIEAELARQGFAVGRNLTIEARATRADDLRAAARELAAATPDVIFAVSEPAIHAAAATGTIPIVIVASADPVRLGWVDTLARPGRNITGVLILGPELDPKRLQLIHDLVPGAERVAVLLDPAITSDDRRIAISDAARDLGIDIDMVEARQPAEIAAAVRLARNLNATALNVLASPLFSSQAPTLAAAAIAAQLPTMCHWREMVEAGCLASYGPPFAETFRLAGAQIGQLLAGARAADIPIAQPTKLDFVINLKTARAIGLEIPPSLLARADEVIE